MSSGDRDRTTHPRPLRSDAAENRERVLAAAVTAVLRDGTNVPLSKIAAEANVGVGTLYRRYPDRAALFAALEVRAFGIVLAVLHEIEETDEPGLALVERFLHRTIAHRSQLVLPMHGAPSAQSEEVTQLRADIRAVISRILLRGRDDGTVRADVQTADIVFFGALISQPLPGVADWDTVARHQVAVFIRGIAAAPAGATTPRPSAVEKR